MHQMMLQTRTVLPVEHEEEIDFDLEFKQARKRDLYDEGVEFLTKHPELIYHAWNSAQTGIRKGFIEHVEKGQWINIHMPVGAFALFAHVSKSRNYMAGGDGVKRMECGCLSQVANGMSAETVTLTNLIRNHGGIPTSGYDIKPEHLPTFAELQRFVDKELDRAPLVQLPATE
jgi:hypothetical protein